ncbi:E3 ubiquitin-protein ligase RNF19A-like isoform X4 [Betta splendens]|uniref:E3 ubiquitin-protein ligase RNF19A-like isoform X4 n=1 Tax=Betta splendens TaxID=158456 RepID=A0A6P7LC35_BETSP|nr:E3 ubiquitin-protein ligase RNF19A-like isoform X4 [Betta splendens]
MSQEEKTYDPLDTTMTFVDRDDDLDPLFSEEDCVSLRAQMSCGHAVTPENLTQCCRSQLEQGNYTFRCQAIIEGVEQCNKPWSYQEVRRMADLSVEEMQEFEEKIALLAAAQYCEIQSCPQCKTSVERKDLSNLCVLCTVCKADREQNHQFCWQCMKPWKGPAPRSDRCDNDGCVNKDLELLRKCKDTVLAEVQGVGACPSIRACPTCGNLVEHDRTGCKNITCPRCQVEFCFVCLKLTRRCLKTSSYFIPCRDGVAPRQTSIPVWRRRRR